MLRPASMSRKPQIYLLDPYDPKKIPILMVHGLQSTPVAFATLVNAVRSDPEIREKYQIWQFFYASGTPVLANGAELRDSLAETGHTLDPQDRDAATKRIVVVGHSMGGVISHTLVSSSQSRVWASVFRVRPAQLKGDPEAVRELVHVLYFRRNPRGARVIFMADPHLRSAAAAVARTQPTCTRKHKCNEAGGCSFLRGRTLLSRTYAFAEKHGSNRRFRPSH